MRVLNDKTLQHDIDNTFDVSLAHLDKKVRDWFKGGWLKQLLKTQWFVDHFLHPIEANASKFQGLGRDASMVAKTKSGVVNIRSFTPFDVKDAKAGILRWYEPTEYSLNYYKYLEEVVLIRDFFNSLIEEDPNVDLRRYNAVDAVRAAQKWHAEEAKREAERRAREEAERLAANALLIEKEKTRIAETATRSLREFNRMEQGVDWTHVVDFEAGGLEYSMIRLISPKALDIESEFMSHCTYRYKKDIYNGRCVIVSVRAKGVLHQPIVTAEIYTVPMQVIQVQGYSNRTEGLPPHLAEATRTELMADRNLPKWVPLIAPPAVTEFRVRLT